MAGYKEIADQLRQEIQEGVYPRGSQLPTEGELARQWGVGTPTINKATQLLRAEGLIRTLRGKGAVVREIGTLTRDASSRHATATRERGGARGAFDAEVASLGHTPRSDVLETGPVTPPAEIAHRLNLERDDVAAIRRRAMYADDVPVQLATSYIPWSIARGTVLTERDTGPGGTYSRLKDLGYEVTRLSEEVFLRRPTATEADALDIPAEQPVQVIYRTARTSDGTPVEVTEHIMPGHQWLLKYEWDVT